MPDPKLFDISDRRDRYFSPIAGCHLNHLARDHLGEPPRHSTVRHRNLFCKTTVEVQATELDCPAITFTPLPLLGMPVPNLL